MFNNHVYEIKPFTEEIKTKIYNKEKAITHIEEIYNILEVEVTYDKFIQICRYIFSKNNIGFDLLTNSKNEIFFVFRKLKKSEFKTFIGTSVCSLCDKNTYGSEHHIKPRTFGGTNATNNLVFLCSNCHDSVEFFCSYCENSKTICDKQMFNSCWRRNNVYFIQTEESRSIFNEIDEIPRFNVTKKHRRKKIKLNSNKCDICKKRFTLALNNCIVKSDILFKLDKTILKGKKDKNIIYMCNTCYAYAIQLEKAYINVKNIKLNRN